MARKSDHPQRRWTGVRRLGDPNVGQAWLWVVTDAEAQYTGEYVYKILQNATDAGRVGRFIQEIEVTKALAKAGLPVVHIVDYGTGEVGRPFLVTPLFARGSLRDSMADGRFVNDLPATLAFVEQLAHAVKQVHERGVAHRDLKPENILIADDGAPILCDFGLCLPLWDSGDEDRISDTLEQIGSRHYTAPEAFGGYPNVRNPFAVDVYATGKIAYELLAGRLLAGFELANGDYHFAGMHADAHGWYLVNCLIA